jgi:hypothetical protein
MEILLSILKMLGMVFAEPCIAIYEYSYIAIPGYPAQANIKKFQLKLPNKPILINAIKLTGVNESELIRKR